MRRFRRSNPANTSGHGRGTDPRLAALEAEARELGYALVPLDTFAGLEDREATVSAALERGRGFAPLVAKLGDLVGELQPAADQVRDLAAENVRLRQRLADHAADFTLVAESLLLAEFPEHCGR
jgi:hypothetical protein